MKQEFWLAIPSIVLEDCPTLRERTEKTGIIARAAAIFGISRICIYKVSWLKAHDGSRFLKLILEYLELPQYLRKRVYPISEELKFAGLLPPLRIPSHLVPAESSKVKVGDIREGIAVKKDGRLFADVGLPKLATISGNISPNSRVTLRIEAISNGLQASAISRKEVQEYWGYSVQIFSSTANMMSQLNPNFTIFTSKKGESINDKWGAVLGRVRKSNNVLIAFGSPKHGLPEILGKEDLHFENSLMLNTVPRQNVETVRTEEAILATLAILNLARD